MSTIKSSAENLTLNADGSGNDIIFQSNGTTKATLDQAGLLTATSFAGSGANLTGIVSTFADLTDTTVSTSSPTITSNPSAIGHLWVNKTSGEAYVCTNITNNENVWKNIGSGTGNVDPYYNMDFLVIAGGGGGYQGGGGAGGYRNSYNSETSGRNSSSESALVIAATVVYTISVGSGGLGYIWSASRTQTNGNNSYISGSNITTVTSIGGGHGLSSNGGSGGARGGSGTITQGFDGGTSGSSYQDSGGGGASANGVSFTSGTAGAGGAGLSSAITGSAVTRAGGGGGAGTGYPNINTSTGAGGAGGGGAGGSGGGNGTGGTQNTGSGAGGGSLNNAGNSIGAAGDGGSGVVILRMPTSNYSGTTTGSPLVSNSGSDTILIFTGSGTYTG